MHRSFLTYHEVYDSSMRPVDLSMSLRSSFEAKTKASLEDQYQEEFFRVLYFPVDKKLQIPPEYVVKRGRMRHNNVHEHMEKLEKGGQ